MIIIPAIDIRGGNCVRLRQGNFSDETIYSSDPVEVAKKFKQQGAQRIHVIDLDGAFSGKSKNADVIVRIAAETELPVQTGGGIRNYEIIKKLLGSGIQKVIMGTAAIYDRQLLRRALNEWPGRISVGIDSKSGKVAVKGWKDVSSKRADKLALEMEKEGVGEIIVTDIKTDGMLKGPNLKWIEKIASGLSIPVIASGGISSIEDIKAIKNLGQDNISGIIVGKAIYSANVSLSEAIEALRE